jgi:transcriptional regulator of acetoin/glycerol metabolism
LSPFALILPENLPERFKALRNTSQPRLSPLERSEMEQIIQVLRATSWNQSKAARTLGIDRKTLRAKIARYGLAKDASEAIAATGK